MSGVLKAVLISILAVASIIVFVNLAFFFPWYMEVIQTTFEVSQMVSTDNYLTYNYYHDTLDELRGKAIFKDRAANVKIEAFHENGKNAIEQGGHHDVNTYYYPLSSESDKPYVQMGKLVKITIHATYPFRMQLFGKPVTAADIPVLFSMTTATTRHYKDLEYDYGPDGRSLGDYDDYG